jgi:hypothetical protein
MIRLLVLVVVLLLGCAAEPDQPCSVTCIAEGLAVSADVCESEVVRRSNCEAPELVREPEVGESVSIDSWDESRETIVFSVDDDGFAVGGPPARAELGSAVIALSDGALLGVVQEFSDTISLCTTL